eukprot:TRINITY_DN13585_c1_g1_i8.p1 TRINITY_DN13585_c1_g1~~TRINITY_DN13585_c1_g1_i8.p1  ORF type:complete len:235 (-),score=44.54 TRINITY_DN13585_c1_g1_i8:35-739(-)
MRAVSCMFCSFVGGLAFEPSGTFKLKFMQDVHGFTPKDVAVSTILLGFLQLLGYPYIGKFGDRFGRRPLLMLSYIICPLGVIAFYNISGWLFLPFYFIQMMANSALWILSTTYYTEQFPDSYRSTASGATNAAQVIGSVVGLSLEAALFEGVHEHRISITLLVLPALVLPLIIYLTLPETAGRELDDIAPENAEAPQEAASGARDVQSPCGKAARPIGASTASDDCAADYADRL